MFHHIVMFRFKDDVAAETIAEIRRDLQALPGLVASIRTYKVGTNARVNPNTWDLVLVAGFDDEAGYRSYRDHPDHLAVVVRIRELTTERAAIQTVDLQ
jgi:hypothetical protein